MKDTQNDFPLFTLYFAFPESSTQQPFVPFHPVNQTQYLSLHCILSAI